MKSLKDLYYIYNPSGYERLSYCDVCYKYFDEYIDEMEYGMEYCSQCGNRLIVYRII